jgi:RNA polymerase sigma-70 factor (ECF subfamily)
LSTEVRLLKGAQRELSAANASASLALLDEHARLYPNGALAAERLGARVFALCKLGKVEQAREAAREFFRVAGSSPLVPRVLASCAGTTQAEKPR